MRARRPRPAAAGPADCGARSAAGVSETSQAPATSPSRASAPLASHRLSHPAPVAANPDTSTAETAMPTPTPANGIHDSSERPAAASRSRTSPDASTIASALATPPAKRSARNAAISAVSPIAAVVVALRTSAPSSHPRRPPGMRTRAAAIAPTRWPSRLADATSPPSDGVRPRSSAMNGRIGV